ncbi:MAG: hypothetical protein ACRDS9_17025 [Pseudonocardiaceae bacterium]
MTNHPMLAAAVLIWLLGAVVGWVVGWAARGEANRLWHRGAAHQLAQTRTQLDEALDELAEAHRQAERVTPPPAPVVHVHVSGSLPWAAPEPMPLDPTRRVVGAVAVRPAGAVQP